EQLPKPEASQKMCCRFSDNIDRLEREEIGVLTLLRDDNRADACQSGNLPIDMQHLRLEKCCAVRCNSRPRFGVGIQGSMITSNIKPQTSNILKKDLEKFDPLPLSGIGIKNHTLGSRAILRRRFRIHHLQRITSADRSRDHP